MQVYQNYSNQYSSNFNALKVKNNALRKSIEYVAYPVEKMEKEFSTKEISRQCMQIAVEEAEAAFFKKYPVFALPQISNLFKNAIREKSQDMLDEIGEIDFNVIPTYYDYYESSRTVSNPKRQWGWSYRFSSENFPIKFNINPFLDKTCDLDEKEDYNMICKRFSEDGPRDVEKCIRESMYDNFVRDNVECSNADVLIKENYKLKSVMKMPEVKAILKKMAALREMSKNIEPKNIYDLPPKNDDFDVF